MQNDDRRYIALSTFGFYKGGYLYVNLVNFHPQPSNEKDIVSVEGLSMMILLNCYYQTSFNYLWSFFCHQYGFSLDRTLSDAMNPYLDSHQEHCLLEEPGRPEQETPNSPPVVYFTMDLKLLRWDISDFSDYFV